MIPYIETIEPKSTSKPDFTIVMLHGLGEENPETFLDIAEGLYLRGMSSNIRIIVPIAPKRAITINNGLLMPAWFNQIEKNIWKEEDIKGIQQSNILIQNLLTDLIHNGTPPNQLFLAGFSQGAALALHIYTILQQPIAGIGIFSGYLPLLSQLSSIPYPQIPVLMVHGEQDTVLPIDLSKNSFRALKKTQSNNAKILDFQSLPYLAHNMGREAMNLFCQFLKKHLNTGQVF